jgi:serine/threonine protein kinase
VALWLLSGGRVQIKTRIPRRHWQAGRSSERTGDRFQREARAISALNHPNICTVYDVGANYLVMELLDGSTLAEEIRKGPLGPELASQYGAQIAAALAEAHGHRFCSRGRI